MTLRVIPIEPIEERYSAQWLKYFDEYFNQNTHLKVEMCKYEPYNYLYSGNVTKIVNGEFLDIVETNLYKSKQLQIICNDFKNNKIKSEDTFLFLDSWFPGLEMLAYIRDGLGIPFKIVGLLHAGTWDDHDFLTQKGMKIWARHLERSWLILMDRVCVATHFHKELIIKRCKDLHPNLTDTALDQKIKVTGFPILQTYVKDVEKLNYIVFPHRLAPEKNAWMFEQLRIQFYDYCVAHHKQFYKDWIFIKTKEYAHNKQMYYDLLNKSKVAISFADQETFGIAMLESALCGCYPIVPDKLSYSELYPEEFKFALGTSYVKCCLEKLIHIIENEDFYVESFRQLQEQIKTLGMNAIPNIITHCYEVHNE